MHGENPKLTDMFVFCFSHNRL